MRIVIGHGNGAIIFSIIVAMALRILPWPHDSQVLFPDWILLIIIYWCLAAPERFGIGSAWLTGLLTDVLTGQLLGQYALAYSIVAYVSIRLHRRLRLFPLSRQVFFILLLLLLSQLLIFWTESMQGSAHFNWRYWVSSFVGAAFWPIIFVVLQGLGHKVKFP